jgi:hypothetical protein
MTRILMVRHGHVEGIEPPRFRGRRELPLTELGQRQAAVSFTPSHPDPERGRRWRLERQVGRCGAGKFLTDGFGEGRNLQDPRRASSDGGFGFAGAQERS